MTAFVKILFSLERFLIAAIMLAMVGLYAMAIFVREFMPASARSVAWVDEATRYMLIWLVFIALGAALQIGRQIAMTSYLDRFPPKLQFAMHKVIDLTGLVFCIYITWIGVEITQIVAGTGQRSPTLGISAAWLYLALPIGFALLALRYGLSLVGAIDRRAVNSHQD